MSRIENWWKSRKNKSTDKEETVTEAVQAEAVPEEAVEPETLQVEAAEEEAVQAETADEEAVQAETAPEEAVDAEILQHGTAEEEAVRSETVPEDDAEPETETVQAEKEDVQAETAPEEAEEVETVQDEATQVDAVQAETAPEEAASTKSSADAVLETLKPADVFGYFREIAAIPHGSFHTEALSDYLEDFAKSHDLPYSRDEMGNLIISRPASEGCEGAAPIALQGHIDMVCEKEASNGINMEQEAITLQTDGEWLWADRTTLGGDDGIAVAMMLALLTDSSIKCPPLECIFTVDEEVGLLGAYSLDLSALKSRRMINLDSESEGIITAACAGGAEEICTLSGRRREKKGVALEIMVSGLLGGHSGGQIGCGRANADILLARLLYRLEKEGKYCLISFNGGNRDNAIPREARAEIIFTGSFKKSGVKAAVTAFSRDISKEYSVTDPGIRIRAKWMNNGKKDLRIAFSGKDTRRMIHFLIALPNGVIENSPLYKDIPQTSLSLGIVKTMADGIVAHSLVRSSINSQKKLLMDRIDIIAEVFGASVDTHGTYPAWELIEKSAFRDLAAEVYQKVTGKEATVCITHGGLECGLLTAKVPGLDCISVGPDMEEIHTPAERLSIPSSARIYEYVRAILEVCAEENS